MSAFNGRRHFEDDQLSLIAPQFAQLANRVSLRGSRRREPVLDRLAQPHVEEILPRQRLEGRATSSRPKSELAGDGGGVRVTVRGALQQEGHFQLTSRESDGRSPTHSFLDYSMDT
jgi:hypothetical protein